MPPRARAAARPAAASRSGKGAKGAAASASSSRHAASGIDAVLIASDDDESDDELALTGTTSVRVPRRALAALSVTRQERADEPAAAPSAAAASSSSSASAPSAKSTKSKSSKAPTKTRRKKDAAAAQPEHTHAQPTAPSMPEEQIASYLENYDLEAERRLEMSRQALVLSVETARRLMGSYISRMARSARSMRLEEFITEHGAQVSSVVARLATTAMRDAPHTEWSSVAGIKRSGDEAAERGTAKNARQAASASGSGSSSSAKPAEANAAPARPSTSMSNKARLAAARAKQAAARRPPPSSPAPSSSSASTQVRPPSSAVFAPRLGAQDLGRSSSVPRLPPTPAGQKGRLARAGETVMWQSINGSPITGVIGPDGAVRPLPPRSAIAPAAAEDESIVELAKGIDAGLRRRRSGEAGGAGAPSPLRWTEVRTAASTSSSPMRSSDASSLAALGEDAAEVSGELPDEEALTRQILAEEAAKQRSRMASSSNSSLRSGGGARHNGAAASRPPSSSGNSSASRPPLSSQSAQAQPRHRVSIRFGSGETRDVASLTSGDVLRIPHEERQALLRMLQGMSTED